jgi:hypothetical protein
VFKATVHEPDGSYPLEVVLGDETGQVVAVEAALEAVPIEISLLPLVEQDPADPNAVLLSWATGACDDVAIALRKSDTGYEINVDAHERIGLGCTAQLLLRSLRIRFAAPISADAITASGGR